jgi:hypothetical protein
VLTPQALSTTKIDLEVNEDGLISSTIGNNFNYHDWKVFYGEEMLRKIAADFATERYALPMIYYSYYILGLVNMQRIRATKYTFDKRTP